MQEIWKDIPGYENLYQVSNFGKVRSLSFGARNHRKSNRIVNLKLSPTNCGYYKVQLYKSGGNKMFYVHRLVALAFLPNPLNKNQINHIDGDKTNNAVYNLEWVNASENQLHAIKNKLRKPSPMSGRTGEKNPLSKTILQYSLTGQFIKEWKGISNAARVLGISCHGISSCVNGRKKSSGGFMWKPKLSTEYDTNIEPLQHSAHSNHPSGYKQKNPRPMHKISQFTTDGTLIRIWDNYRQIENETSYNNANIYNVIQGKSKTAYGFIWQYAD